MSHSSSTILRIAQISDTHIGDTHAFVQGIDVRNNFLRVLKTVKEETVDLLVFSGDLAAYQGERGAYQFIADAMRDYELPWCCISGNHDITSEMVKGLNLTPPIKNDSYYYQLKIKERSLFFLDSSPGVVSTSQLLWFKEEASCIKEDVLLFIHHPPCLCHHRFMDAHYSMRNRDEVQKTLNEVENLHHIFTGHYHADMIVLMGDKNVYVTPSTQMQLDCDSVDFKIASLQPAWRLIEWAKDSLKTSVHFL